jgi:hypothetical protein
MNRIKTPFLCAGAIPAFLFSCGAAFSAQIFQDGFESGDLKKPVGSATWAGGQFADITDTVAHTGKYSLRLRFNSIDSGNSPWGEQRFYLGAIYKQVDIQWYAYYPKGDEGLGPKYFHRSSVGGNNNKLVRLWMGDKSDGAQGYGKQWVKAGASTWACGISWKCTVPGDAIVGGELGTDTMPTGQYNIAESTGSVINNSIRGRWVRFNFKASASSAVGKSDGFIEIDMDGVKVLRTEGLPLYSEKGNAAGFEYGYLMGWANSQFQDQTYVYIDDVTINSSPSPGAPGNLKVQ